MGNDSYWQIISDKAASDSFKESGPFGSTLFSLESTSGESASDIFSYAAEHRASFLKLLDVLHPEKKEIAIEYIILRKTEAQIATLHGKKSQSMMGREIAAIVKVLGAALVLGMRPSAELLKTIFAEEKLKVPDLKNRKALRGAQHRLASSKTLRSIACSEYLGNILAQPTRASRARMRRLRGKIFRDPSILGDFQVNMHHPKISAMFTARARQVSNASEL